MATTKSTSTEQDNRSLAQKKEEKKVPREALAKHLKDLANKYPGKHDFPSIQELNEIQLLVRKIVGPRKRRPMPSRNWDNYDQVDKHYPKIGLKDFLDKLVDKIAAIPPGPFIKLRKVIGTLVQDSDSTRKQRLEEIVAALTNPHFEIGEKDHPWAEWYEEIKSLTSASFRYLLACSKSTSANQIDFDQCLVNIKPFLGYVAFMDLQRQRCVWQRLYTKEVFKRAPLWVCQCLQNTEYSSKVLAVFDERDLISTDEQRKSEIRELNQARVRKHRELKKQSSSGGGANAG